jgi:Flp pilus assembly protein TadG
MEGRTVAEAKKIGEAFFANNIQAFQRSGATVPTPKIVADSQTQQVTVDAAVTVPMSLMRIGGFKEMAVPVRSQVKFATKDVEVGVAIDVTGSMGQSIAGQTKISSLKVAFSNFVDMMIPDEGVVGRKVRIGVAP